MSNKDKFIEIYKENIKRDGADKLLKYLETSDFFTAPASSKFHGAYDGGLCDHSLNVYSWLKKLQTKESDETIAICALLHDICKTNFYVKDTKNVKNADGKWVTQDYYRVEDKLFYGHGEGSVYILMSYLKLTREEALAIRWHMSGFDSSVKGGDYSQSGAYDNYPLCSKLAAADMLATFVTENIKGDKNND